MSESMIGRVKDAIYDAADGDMLCDGISDRLARVLAVAAIGAMREPTPTMTAAAHPGRHGRSWRIGTDPNQENIQVWTAMIDAALKS